MKVGQVVYFTGVRLVVLWVSEDGLRVTAGNSRWGQVTTGRSAFYTL